MALQLKPEYSEVLSKIKECIERYGTFLITTHQNPDGDAIGSEIAIYILLKRLGKKAWIVNSDKSPDRYSFLPLISNIENELPSEIKNPEAVFVLDCGELERTGEICKYLKGNPVLINIDHHVSNKNYGTVNFASDKFSSTGEMVYLILKTLGEVTREQAICLYAAIINDTGNFSYNVGALTFQTAKELVEAGADPEMIYGKMYLDKPFKSLKLLALALETLSYDKAAGVCWMTVRREMCSKLSAGLEHTEGFVEFLAGFNECNAAFLVKESEGGVRVSMRSRGRYDVEKIARNFGGGGHKKASGCSFKNISAAEAAEKILSEIKKT